jgi:hypothetical protein
MLSGELNFCSPRPTGFSFSSTELNRITKNFGCILRESKTHATVIFCRLCITVYQYNETNVKHFLFILLRIKGLYMFRALLSHHQKALHKRHLVYCVRIMQFHCNGGIAILDYKHAIYQVQFVQRHLMMSK